MRSRSCGSGRGFIRELPHPSTDQSRSPCEGISKCIIIPINNIHSILANNAIDSQRGKWYHRGGDSVGYSIRSYTTAGKQGQQIIYGFLWHSLTSIVPLSPTLCG